VNWDACPSSAKLWDSGARHDSRSARVVNLGYGTYVEFANSRNQTVFGALPLLFLLSPLLAWEGRLAVRHRRKHK